MGRLYKTGGRKKGTPNKRTSLVERLLEKMEADPIGHMSRVRLQGSQTTHEPSVQTGSPGLAILVAHHRSWFSPLTRPRAN